MKITLKDGSSKEYQENMRVIDIAKDISEGLARMACAGEVNGEVVDLRYVVDKDCELNILTFNDDKGKDAFRHTAAHILAQAVKRLYPNVKLAIGPAIENGFYYDFDTEKPFTSEELKSIEKEMKKIVKENLEIEKIVVSKEEALKRVRENGELYKEELINELDENSEITFYQQGEFMDLCAGPHLMSTKPVKAFKLISSAGAYWKGDEKNKMLSRIYGTAFTKKSDLEEYITQLEEAKKRDHNKLGRELELFTTNETIGQGLPLLMPKGAKIVQILQRFIEDEEEKRGYELTKTPFLAKSDLYKVSGHWDHYRDGMFVLGDEEKDDEVFALRPMTCPFQYMIYKAKQRSYRDLPIRYAETSPLFRKESSGEMHGLIRLRQFTLADGHIICTPEQVEEEFKGVVDLIDYVMKTIGIDKDIWYRFSKWDPNNKGKYIDNPEAWKNTQEIMKKILDDIGLDYKEAEGEAAFYGPKLDIQFKNVHGKEDTIITVQLDFSLAERFDMSYVDKDNEKKRPLIIHRSSIGCYERTLAMLIEKFAGQFPTWLSPVQAKVLPISEKYEDYGYEVMKKLKDRGIRVEIDDRAEKIGYKIREARLERVPYLLIVGQKEEEEQSISVRSRYNGDEGLKPVEEFIEEMLQEIQNKEIKEIAVDKE
ncbi:threonyl-tRNA synthetase [Natranaerovirga hydrolytica]|uniref:Threonine--tRNA ligase n=1 Tax=Natranaerovirga hydrolytica TaxID=680378 RepID=A0A4R1MM74_9FIRM|nr:threonine--tRNA ligase [Natranaerovirga hydrolytica]TCK92374.1 threonyl-tRNA synthetase [Natranaerovirga hydrolytica]